MKWNFTVFLLCLIGIAITSAGIVYTKHKSRTLFSEIQRLHDERDSLNTEWGQLQLEQSAWSTHGRVEKIARGKLGMFLTNGEKVVVLKP